MFLGALNDPGDAEEFVAGGEGEELHALTTAIDFADRVHRATHALALGGQEHDLIGVFDAERTGEFDGAVFGEVDGPDATAAAIDETIVFETRADAEAGFAGDEEFGGVIDDFDDIEVVALELEPHAGDAAGGAAGGAEVVFAGLGIAFAEADGEALMRDEDEFVAAGGEDRADDGVRPGEVDADETAVTGAVPTSFGVERY